MRTKKKLTKNKCCIAMSTKRSKIIKKMFNKYGYVEYDI